MTQRSYYVTVTVPDPDAMGAGLVVGGTVAASDSTLAAAKFGAEMAQAGYESGDMIDVEVSYADDPDPRDA